MNNQSNNVAELEKRVKQLEATQNSMIHDDPVETLRSVGNALEFLIQAEFNNDEGSDERHTYVHTMTRDVLLWSAVSAVEYERQRIRDNGVAA